MINTGSFELKDYVYDMRRCMRCASCKWIDHTYMADNRFVYRCPSYGKYYFSKVAYGRLKLGLALAENRLDDTPGMTDMVFQCLMCGACDSGCKRNLDLEIGSSLEALRHYMVERGTYPKAHDKVIQNIAKRHNKFGAPVKERTGWVSNGRKRKAETVYFVGCNASYVQTGIASSTEKILNALGGYMLLPAEWCCGHPLFAMGHYDAFEKQMAHNFEAMKKTGAKQLVTSCAECYKTWKVDYPRMMNMSTTQLPFEVLHITELVASGLKRGELKLPGKLDLKVAWHDPCNLGRMSEPYIHWEGTRGQWGCLIPEKGFASKEFRRGTEGVYEEPRDVLSHIAGLDFVELTRHHEFSWCCGGHGGVPEAYPEMTAYAVSERLEEVKRSGAEAVVSACPYCKETFEAGVKDGGYQAQVFDITEIIAQAL
jgi:Fe-S oxidoreductase